MLFFGADIVRGVPVLTDELDQLLVEHDTLVQSHRKRLGIGLRIIDRHFDFKRAEIWAAESLDDSSFIGQRVAVHVEPDTVNEARRLDNESISLPLSDGVAIPPGLRIVVGERTPVREYLT